MADRPEHLVARQRQLDRAAELAGGEDGQRVRPGHVRLGAEAAAEERAADMDVLRRNPEEPGIAHPRQHDRLVGRVERQAVAVPLRDHRVRLHGVVVLVRRLVFGLDAPGCRRMPRGDVALLHRSRIAEADGGRIVFFQALEAEPHGFGLVGRGEQARAFVRRLQCLGHHEGDRLLGVADAIVLQRLEAEAEHAVLAVGVEPQLRHVVGRVHLDHARMRLRRRHVERGDAPARDAAGRNDAVEQVVGVVVGGVGRLAGDLQHAVAAGHRLAAVGAEAHVPGGRNDIVRHWRKLRCWS